MLRLKGQCHAIFDLRVFCMNHLRPGPEYFPLATIQIFSKIYEDIRSSWYTTAVVDTGGKFTAIVNDTVAKFATAVNDAGGNLPTAYCTHGTCSIP